MGRRRAARALLPGLTLGYPAELGALGPDGHPPQRAGISAARPCRASTTSACRSAYFASATLRAVGAVAGHVVRTLRRRLDAPASACCGARRRRLPRASRSSNVRTASSLTHWHIRIRPLAAMAESQALGQALRSGPAQPARALERTPAVLSSSWVRYEPRWRISGSGPGRPDLTMRTLSVQAQRLEATFCPLYVVEASPAARHSNSSPLALAPPGVRPASDSRAQVPCGSPWRRPQRLARRTHCRDGLSGGWSSCWLSPARPSEQPSGPPVARRIESARRTALGHGRRPVGPDRRTADGVR